MIKVSFFSYKGGAGRSSVAYNVIPLMAKELGATPTNPIIVVDMDIDSAGMTFLLSKERVNVNEKAWPDDVYSTDKLLENKIPGLTYEPEEDGPLSGHPLFSKLAPVGNEFGLSEDQSILLIPVKLGTPVQSFDQGGESPLSKLSKLCRKYGCKALIFDTPTGDQMGAGWSLSVSDTIVCCMRITYQFRIGTINHLKRKDNEFEKKRFILVPNAVPQENIVVDGELRNFSAVKDDLINKLKGSYKLVHNEMDLGMFEGDYFGIPEVRRFKIEEGILLKAKKMQPDEEKALACFERLAKLICRIN